MPEELRIMPKPERDDDRGGFFYDEKYIGKLFIHQGQYIYFKENSYDTFPQEIVDKAVSSFIKEHPIEVPAPDISESDIETIVKNSLDDYVNRISGMMDKLTDKVNSKLDLTDLQQFRDTVQAQIDEYFESKFQELTQADPVSEDQIISAIDKQLPKIKSLIDKQSMTTETVQNIVREELIIVHDSMGDKISEIVEAEMSKLSEKITPINKVEPESAPKLGMSQLMMLKESGYTVDEIAQLKQSGLI